MKQKEVVDGLAGLLAQSVREREELEGKIAGIREREKGMRQALRALDPKHKLVASQEKKRRPKRAAAGVKPETIRRVAEAVVDFADDGKTEFKAPDVEAVTGLNGSSSRRALEALRSGEALLSLGKRPGPNGRRAEFYGVGDLDVLRAAAGHGTMAHA